VSKVGQISKAVLVKVTIVTWHLLPFAVRTLATYLGNHHAMTTLYKFSNYTFDAHAGLVYEEQGVHLPPKEKGLLQALLLARGQIVRKEDLMEKVWGTHETSDESISRTVYRLRVAMQACGGPEVVETVYNSGFRIKVPVCEVVRKECSTLNALTHSTRPNAIAALISARELLARQNLEDIEAAAQAARLAVSLDPGYAAAWTTLVEVRIVQAVRSLRPPREAGWLAKEAAQTALNIDPQSAAALAILGWVRAMIEQDGAQGLEELDRAQALDADFWFANLLRGWALQAVGRGHEAVAMVHRAQELNPSSYVVNALPAHFQMLAGKLSEAHASARELVRRFPTVDNAHAVASVMAALHGLHDEAELHGRRAMALAPNTPLMVAPLAYALANARRPEEARALLQGVEDSTLPQPSVALAPVYLALGDKARAVALLVDASERGIPQCAWTRDDPRLAGLRGDPVVQRLWAGLGRPAALVS